MLVLDQAAVTDLLDPEALIDALPSAMVSLSQGAVSLPPRIGVQVEDHQSLLAADAGLFADHGFARLQIGECLSRQWSKRARYS